MKNPLIIPKKNKLAPINWVNEYKIRISLVLFDS